MKELIEKILPYLPQYLGDLGALLVSPKRFMAGKDTQAPDVFVQSLVFAAVSTALAVMVTMPLYPQKDLWTRLGAWAVEGLVDAALLALALRAAWFVVGGRAPLRSFFVTCAYLSSGFAILLAMSFLLFAGVFRTFDPESYAWFVQQLGRPVTEAFSGPGAQITVANAGRMLAILSVFLVSQIAIALWSVAAWGCLRALNGVSRWRSAGAMLIASILAVPCLMVGSFIAIALNIA